MGRCVVVGLIVALSATAGSRADDEKTEKKDEGKKKPRTADVVYVATPHDVVARMLDMAKVTKDDVVYDLGCGDGRIIVTAAKKLDKVSYEEMLEQASLGAKVLQVRSVELGMVHNMPIFVRSSFDKPEDIDPHGTPPGTLISSEEESMENHVVTGIAFTKDEAQISVRHVPDKPGVAAAIFGPLAEASINVDMIVQNVSADGATIDSDPGDRWWALWEIPFRIRWLRFFNLVR